VASSWFAHPPGGGVINAWLFLVKVPA